MLRGGLPSTPPLTGRRVHFARLPSHDRLSRLLESLSEKLGRLSTGQGDLAVHDEERHARCAEVARLLLASTDGIKPGVARQHRSKTRAKLKSEVLRQKDAAQVQALPVLRPHAAGIDIGSRSHWVCVGFTTEAGSCSIQEFPAHTAGLKAIAAFLREHQVDTIAMESTGIYWSPLYELLQAEGFEVLLVDPGYSRQLRGRPKTDRRDCQWIYRLHSVGLLASAFRPDEKTCWLRAYLRQRANLVLQASKHVQHMQKALEQMNLKLTEVLSDITSLTGRPSSGRSCVGHEHRRS